MGLNEIIIFSAVSGFAMFMGSALIFYFDSWVSKNSIFLISFAAGVMLTIAFMNLIPEALSIAPGSWTMDFAGFLALYALQNIVMFHPCHDEVCETHKLGLFSFAGLVVHSLLDGVIVAVGFEAGFEIGLLTTTAVILHKLPDGITITSILIHSKMKKKTTVMYSSLVALATPVGAVIAYFFFRNIAPGLVGSLLALTAGSFIYLAAADLLPETHKRRNRANALFFFLGIGAVALIGKIFAA